MYIEIKNISINVRLSEETPAYTAKVFVDGKHFADVSNHGHGAPDCVYPPKHVAPNDKTFSEALEALEAYIGTTYPKMDMSMYDMEDIAEKLEGVCQKAAWDHVERRNLKSRISKKLFILDNDQIYSFKGKRSEAQTAAVKAKYPNAIILSDIAFDDAWDYFQLAS